VFNAGLRLAASGVVSRAGSTLFTPPADQIELPDYSHLLA
jgi:hypothetical protein